MSSTTLRHNHPGASRLFVRNASAVDCGTASKPHEEPGCSWMVVAQCSRTHRRSRNRISRTLPAVCDDVGQLRSLSLIGRSSNALCGLEHSSNYSQSIFCIRTEWRFQLRMCMLPQTAFLALPGRSRTALTHNTAYG